MIDLPITVEVSVNESVVEYEMSASNNLKQITLDNSTIINATIYGETYKGDYEITPTAEGATLNTKELLMTDNLVIKPIPSNYGLIEWDGSYLTVS